MSKLPTNAKERKTVPLVGGLLDYFPLACAAVAHCSYVGNQQHSPGQPLRWVKHLSSDHADAMLRHLLERGTIDSDGIAHSAKVAWRALALLQTELEKADEVKVPGRPGHAISSPERIHVLPLVPDETIRGTSAAADGSYTVPTGSVPRPETYRFVSPIGGQS